MSETLEGPFSFDCPYCSKKLRAKLRAIGRKLNCPNCSRQITVPPQRPESPGPGESTPEEPASGVRRPSLFDVDELVLEEPPIDNLEERKRQSQAVQDAKAAEHRRRLTVEHERQASHGGAPQEVVQPHSRRQAHEDQFRDSYTLCEPNDVESCGKNVASNSKSDQAKQTTFDDDLPELVTQQTEAAVSLPSQAEVDLERIVAALGKQAIQLDLNNLNTIPEAEAFEDKYRVTCPTCGTVQYTVPAAQGSKLKCPDCTSKFTIPPPPANWKPSRVRTRHQQFDEQSPLAVDSEIAQVDQQRRQQTQAMLQRAEVELSEEEDKGRLYEGDFDTRGFLRRTFGFALDPVAVGIMLGYAAAFALIFAMLQFGLSSDGTMLRQGAMLFCALTAPVMAIVFGMPMISAALAQLESAANQQNRVTDWPSMNVFDHFGDIMAVSVALVAAAIPGYLLGLWFGADLVTAGRLQITGVMLTTFLLFPVFYLSILDSGSVLQLISQDVLRSIKEVGEAWGGYYLKTLIVFLATLIAWYLLLGHGKPPVLGAIAGAMLPGLVFFTFHQLGLLADSIGENLSPSALSETGQPNAAEEPGKKPE